MSTLLLVRDRDGAIAFLVSLMLHRKGKGLRL
jgi:hypothetical protein